MLIFTEEFKKKPLFFMKFSKHKWMLESLQNGNIYMNTIGFFKKMEDETKRRGMGDAKEGGLLLNQMDISIYDNETGQLCMKGISGKAEIKFQEDLEKHVFCMSYLDLGDLKPMEEGPNFIRCKAVLSEKQKNLFKNEFGEYVLLYSCSIFVSNVKKTFEQEGIQGAANIVRYSDYSVNYADRINDFMSGTDSKYFWKDTFFGDQKEYRIIVLNRDSTVPIMMKIDDMKTYSQLITVDELFNDKCSFEITFDPEKDLIKGTPSIA